ncbi:MAG: hypothetical protein ACJ762_17610 [Solirubrobacteraceae bacterium]
MDKPTAAILLTLIVHVVGIGALFWLAMDGSFDWRSWWPGDDDDHRGGGEPDRPAPVGPGGVPIADAEPARVRLRTEHERLPGTRRPLRRPEHAPQPARTREPA